MRPVEYNEANRKWLMQTILEVMAARDLDRIERITINGDAAQGAESAGSVISPWSEYPDWFGLFLRLKSGVLAFALARLKKVCVLGSKDIFFQECQPLR